MSGEQLDPGLRAALRASARTVHLLVACDFDGTLAPIVEEPSAARARPEAATALHDLVALRDTSVVVLSGRSLRDLVSLTAFPPDVTLVGSHGSEFGVAESGELDERQALLLEEILAGLHSVADGVPGVMVETKPAGASVHVRRATRPDASRVLAAVLAGPATLPGVHAIEGKEVVELSVLAMDKGAALGVLRGRTGATATLFIGDDVTDERAFARLGETDVGIKVGPGDTLAEHRVLDTTEAAMALTLLAQYRSDWNSETSPSS